MGCGASAKAAPAMAGREDAEAPGEAPERAPEHPTEHQGRMLQKLIAKWTDHVSLDAKGKVQLDGSAGPIVPGPELSDEECGTLERHVEECLEGRGGELSAISHAVRLGNTYNVLSKASKARLFQLLVKSFGVDHAAVRTCCERVVAAGSAEDTETRAAATRELAKAIKPRYERVFKLFNSGLFSGSSGVSFLVKLRAELISLLKEHPELQELDTCLCDLLTNWFDLSFLELTQVRWDASPASVLASLMEHEAVHKIKSWDDMRHRLEGDRRVYAYFHPLLKNVPLIFVEVALVQGIPNRIADLLHSERHKLDPKRADTAAFYSITNTQSGLARISFGNFLIKKVAAILRDELPNLKTFVTLSPIPGFAKWADSLDDATWGKRVPKAELAAVEETAKAEGVGRTDALRALARRGEGAGTLTRLVAHYLLREKARGAKPRDPVSRFHLNNGAALYQINVSADMSDNGMKQSCGLMVNYRYTFADVEANHEAYNRGEVVASPAVQQALPPDSA